MLKAVYIVSEVTSTPDQEIKLHLGKIDPDVSKLWGSSTPIKETHPFW